MEAGQNVIVDRAPGIRLHRLNRRPLRGYRFKQTEPLSAVRSSSVTIVNYSQTWSPSSSVSSSRPTFAPSTVVNPITVYWDQLGVAKNRSGDCPMCGAFGEHSQSVVRCVERNGSRAIRTVRRCRNCGGHFEGLPLPEVSTPTPAIPVVVYSRLKLARDRFHDCPEPGCRAMTVVNRVEVRDSGTNNIYSVLKCQHGHHFRPYRDPID